MNLEAFLKPYCDSLIKGIETENWYLTLMGACTLPDICNSLEGKCGGKAYVDWVETYVTDYVHTVHTRKGLREAKTVQESLEIMNKKVSFDDYEKVEYKFLSGVNVYALRCAYLHNGDGLVSKQQVYSTNEKKHAGTPDYDKLLLDIKKVRFDVTNPSLVLDRDGEDVILHPKNFTLSILEGVYRWIEFRKNNENILKRAKELLVVEGL